MIRFRALGQGVFEIGHHRVTPESDVLFALLLILTSRRNQRITRAEILELLWPGDDPRRSRHRLRQAVYQLRKLGAAVAAADSTLSCDIDQLQVDYLTCGQDVDSALTLVAETHPFEFLPRYNPGFSRPFARWVESERERVHALLRKRLLGVLEQATAPHYRDQAIPIARAYLGLDPLHADVAFILAESLALSGDREAALAVLDRFTENSRGTRGADRLPRLRQRILAASRRAADHAEPDMPMVGRRDILHRLESWLATDRGVPRVLAMIGEPGIGKTRLLHEGARNAGVRGMRLVEYRASVNGEERPLVGLLDILPRFLTLPGAVGCAPASYERLTMLSHGQHGEVSIPSDTNDSTFRFAVIRRAIIDLVDAVCAETEVLVAIDDAHRFDEQSLEILLDAAIASRGKMALLLALRPFRSVSNLLAERGGASMVSVPRLSAADSRKILSRNLTPSATSQTEELIEWAVDLADGNPFFLVQLANHCLQDEGGRSLPDSLQLSLSERIAALSPTAQLILQACAVLAHNASFARIEVMLDLPAHSLAAALAELHPTGLFAVREQWIGCRHELIADAVIRSLGGSLETYLHRRCAVVLDGELEASPVSSLAWDCARHWDIAQDHDRALAVTNLIIDRLLSLGLPRAAADLSERAKRLCKTAEQEAERLLRLSQSLRLLHDWEGVITALETRNALIGARSRTARGYSEDDIILFEARWWRRFDGRVLRQSHRRVADANAPTLHRLQMAVIALVASDNRQRPNEAQQIIELVESIEPKTPREEVEFLRAKTVFHTSFGSLETAVQAAARLVHAERAVATTGSLMQSLRWQSKPLKLTNNVVGAFAALDESYQLAARLDLPYETLIAALYAIDVAVDTEDLASAKAWAQRAADISRCISVSPAQRSTSAYLNARIAAMEGDLREANKLLATARATDPLILRTRGEEPLLAFEIYLRTAMHNAVGDKYVKRLRKLHDRTVGCGVHDFETGVLVAALANCGDVSGARDIYTRYVLSRRSRLEHHSILKTAAARIEMPRAAYEALTAFDASPFASV